MIKGKKVTLRPVKKSDFPLLYQWINEPEVARFWYGKDKPLYSKISVLIRKKARWTLPLRKKQRPLVFLPLTLLL